MPMPNNRPVDVVELAAAAGGGAEALGEEIAGCVWFRQDWLAARGLDPALCAVIRVVGESMEPLLREGDSILVDRHRLRPLHRRAQRHPVHPRGTHCLKRQHGALQAPGTSDPRRPPPPPLRQGQGPRPRIPRRHNGRLPWTAMSGAIPRRWPTDRQPNPRGRVTRFDATDRRPVDKWTAAPRPTTSPQGQQPQQKRSTHMVHKPVNSECSRQALLRISEKIGRWLATKVNRAYDAFASTVGAAAGVALVDLLVDLEQKKIGGLVRLLEQLF